MSLDRVPGTEALYIGGLITLRRYTALKQANITHVVSVLRLPLDKTLFEPYKHLLVEVDDVDDEDIIQHFATANAFIQEGLDGGGGVLVHCVMGKSRSATLVIAYLLSKLRTETPSSALDSLRRVRPIVEPNEGFSKQLELYHSMGCPPDVATQPPYQRWLYQREVELSVACGRAPDYIRFEDEAAPVEETSRQELEIRCRRCRRALATSTYLLPHIPKPASATQAAVAGPINSIDDAVSTAEPAATQCAHLFVDPLSWMRPELDQGKLDGRLDCPNLKCHSLVGKYAWQGMRCSCGKWVVPAISLARGRVDEVRIGTRPLVRGLEGKI